MGARLITLNIRGSRNPLVIDALLREAKRFSIDVLLLQEVNTKSQDVDKIQKRCKDVGWTAYISPSGSPDERGGTAVLVWDQGAATALRPVADHSTGDTIAGRVCAVECTLGDKGCRLVSMYGPSAARSRIEFFNRVSRTKVLTKNTICAGDLNCVPNVAKDVSHSAAKAGATYPNVGGRKCEETFLEAGLTDIFRLIRGDEREYTRYEEDVQTRIDRFYAAAYSSDWRWPTIKTDTSFFRGTSHKAKRSDHLAVFAEIEWIGDRKKTVAERSIRRELLRDPEVQEGVRTRWQAVYAQFPPEANGWASTWELAKEAVTEYLLEMSARPSDIYIALQCASAEANMLYKVLNSKGPSAMITAKLTQAEDEVGRLNKELHNNDWKIHTRVRKEEESSKEFHRLFKARHTSRDISSMHITPNWNDPQPTGITTTNKGVARQCRKYYEWLFAAKSSEKADRLLDLLKRKQISSLMKSRMDKPFELQELQRAIRGMAEGKSPGPDKLPAEFYQEFEDLITEGLQHMIEECLDTGSFSPAVREGEIILLYKKSDPRDIRNYRPITLLNVDYKIFAKMMVARLGPTMDDIVHKAQLGFVPGRVITEATHFLKMVQAAIDEEDEEGLIIACDWEKAFDRVSWEYLHKAVDNLGFGPVMAARIKAMYNKDAPPRRRIRVNGETSEWFTINSGVPQGCPTSPLIFLLVAESLSRAVEASTDLEGVTIGGQEYRLSQFADDTQIILKNYSSLKAMWDLLAEYELATGMRANAKKFEGIRCGRTKRKEVERNDLTNSIKWVKPGDYVRILGIPFWEEYDVENFWIEKYDKMKLQVAAWRHHKHLTLVGANLITNAMVYGRFRYYIQAIAIPTRFVNAIYEDAQALIWSPDVTFDAEELGTAAQIRRFTGKASQHGSRKLQLGGGLLDWKEHVKALQAIWILKYLDAARGDWKLLLDRWFAREVEGRGAVLSTLGEKEMCKSASQRNCCLPKFWKDALHAIRTLKLLPLWELKTTPENARAHPIWFSPLRTWPPHRLDKIWREKLEYRRVGDAFHANGEQYSIAEVEEYIRATVTITERMVEGEIIETIRISPGQSASLQLVLDHWFYLIHQIPTFMSAAIMGIDTKGGRYGRTARKIMSRQGWKEGQGLGKHGQGTTEPVSLTAYTPGEGLGFGNQKKKAKKKTKNQKIFAIENGSEILYGTWSRGRFSVVDLSLKGTPKATSKTIAVTSDELRPTIKWRHGIVGVADITFPHPEEWRFEGIDKPLDTITVRDLTRAFSAKGFKEPSCKKKWEAILGAIDWFELGKRYTVGLATPKDFGSHYKLITHRAMRTRGQDWQRVTCRVCGAAQESIAHWGECGGLRPIFEEMRKFDEGDKWDEVKLNLFGMRQRGVETGVSLIHFLLWKFTLIALTKKGKLGIPINTDDIIEWSKKRLQSRLAKLRIRLSKAQSRAAARERTPLVTVERKWVKGIGQIEIDGYATTFKPSKALGLWLQ